MTKRKFYSCNSSNDLGCESAGLLRGGAQGQKGVVLDLGLGLGAEIHPPVGILCRPSRFLMKDIDIGNWKWRKKRTRAVKVFFRASPAAFRTCRGEVSSTSTDESMSMYSGYMVAGWLSKGQRDCASTYVVVAGSILKL